MNQDDHEAKQDDLLEQAIAAAGDEASLSALPQRTIADTLAALRKTGKSPGIFQRVIAMTMTHKIAAAVVLTVGGLAVYFVLSLFTSFSSVSYAQVAAQIREAKSMTFKITAHNAKLDKNVTLEMMLMEPGRVRMQMTPEMLVIEDSTTGQAIVINSKAKTATIMDVNITGPRLTYHGGADYVERFKKLADGQGEPVGEEDVGGIKTKKFHVKVGDRDATVYANAKTGALVKVDYGTVANMTSLVMSDFNFDAKLTPETFSMQPPAGFTIEKTALHISGDVIENVKPVLKLYAEHNNGKFPPDLCNWGDLFTKMAGTTRPTTLPAEMKETLVNVGTKIGTIPGLLAQYQKGKTYDYLPSDVKLGDADKIVFWYQPKDSKTFKAIYGDLHVADVTADKLPTPPAP